MHNIVHRFQAPIYIRARMTPNIFKILAGCSPYKKWDFLILPKKKKKLEEANT